MCQKITKLHKTVLNNIKKLRYITIIYNIMSKKEKKNAETTDRFEKTKPIYPFWMSSCCSAIDL